MTDEQKDEINELPEAPESVTVKGYYKKFSILLTKRNANVKVMPILESAMKAVDWMVANGFQPSWNDETNGVKPVVKTTAATPTQVSPVCAIHQIPMTWKEGVSSKTNRPYAFWSCAGKMADGGFCSFKPDMKLQRGVQGVAQPQVAEDLPF